MQLEEESIIHQPHVFMFWNYATGSYKKLKAGEYEFSPGVSGYGVTQRLVSGKTVIHKVTIPEGLCVKQIMVLLEGTPKLTPFQGTPPEEGTLLPETYNFTYGDSANDLIGRMQAAMQNQLQELWNSRDPSLPLKTQREVVTLASIVEKETGLAAERPRVAGVFYARLRKGMKLQTDPTVAYAIAGQPLNRPLTRNDLLKVDSPYNTYLHEGLPPGPIANPGRASLEAVLKPLKTDELYFVADGTGGHRFSKTLEDHNRNVTEWRHYQKNGAAVPVPAPTATDSTNLPKAP